MLKILSNLRSVFANRRHHAEHVHVDRRFHTLKLKEADQRMQCAVDDLDKTVRMNRHDFVNRCK